MSNERSMEDDDAGGLDPEYMKKEQERLGLLRERGGGALYEAAVAGELRMYHDNPAMLAGRLKSKITMSPDADPNVLAKDLADYLGIDVGAMLKMMGRDYETVDDFLRDRQ